MVKAMRRRDVERRLSSNGCHVISSDDAHDKWGCRCGRHTANVPRHNVVSPGVIRNTIARMACLPKGWLQ